MLGSKLFGTKLPYGISVDVTHRCNLRCKHCYFFQQDYEGELNDGDFLKRIKEIKKEHPGIFQANWVGGEPLLRKKVVEKAMKLFQVNCIMTNGTIELPKWKDCFFYVSVDGTKEICEKIRGKGIYDKIKKNADRNDIKVTLACVLNKENYHCIEDMLEEWKKTKVKGIIFDFYTPIKGIKEDFYIEPELRDKIIDKLLKLKKKYGKFIWDSEALLNSMKSKNAHKVTSHCILPKAIFSMDPMGKRKFPCILGKKADCSKCGCVIPFHLHNILLYKWIKGNAHKQKNF